MKICANCARNIERAPEIGVSSLYFPDGFDIELCMACWNAEEALIETSGRNDHPERLSNYLLTIGRRTTAKRVLADAVKEGRP